MKIKTLHTFYTEYPADTVEWCPNEGYRTYFACGTYNLENNGESSEAPCRRKGTIILLKFDRETKEMKEVFRCQTAAILDMKWLPPTNSTLQSDAVMPTLATANALGEIDIYTLESDCLELRASASLNSECSNLLALSLDWDRLPNDTTDFNRPRRIIASDSKGDISLLEYTMKDAESHKLENVKSWQAHNFEAWICSFDKWDCNLAYTGGDDLMVHCFDLRTYERVLTNRSHIAGVTSMLSHPKREHTLLTGSYDERVRIFDTRSMRHPFGEINLQGGIWRLKSDPYKGDMILAACMYKNFSVVHMPVLGSGDFSFQLLAVYNEHKSICYGAEWCLDVNEEDEEPKNLYMATCSFYDNKLCVSNVQVE